MICETATFPAARPPESTAFQVFHRKTHEAPEDAEAGQWPSIIFGETEKVQFVSGGEDDINNTGSR